MTVLSLQQAYSDAEQAGFSGQGLNTIVAIAEAESGLNTQAENCNNPGGSCDRGIVQINNYWHSEISDQQAYNPITAFQAAYQISSSGTNFSPWTTYTNGSYKQYLTEVEALGGQTPTLDTANVTGQMSLPGWLPQISISPDAWYRLGFGLVGLILVYFSIKHFMSGGNSWPGTTPA